MKMIAAPGKGQRVTGVFLVVLGGGFLLETTATASAGSILLIGVALLLWGYKLGKQQRASGH